MTRRNRSCSAIEEVLPWGTFLGPCRVGRGERGRAFPRLRGGPFLVVRGAGRVRRGPSRRVRLRKGDSHRALPDMWRVNPAEPLRVRRGGVYGDDVVAMRVVL